MKVERVTIQANTQTVDTYGAAGTDAWAPIGTRPTAFAAIEPLSGREFFDAQRVNSEVTHRGRFMYRADWRDVLTPKHRIVTAASVYDILSAVEIEARARIDVLMRERL